MLQVAKLRAVIDRPYSTWDLGQFRQPEHAGLPGTFIQIQTTGLQIAAFAVVDGVAQLILKPPGVALEVGKGQSRVTLALVWRVVRSNHNALVVWALPGKGDETIRGPIAVPGGRTFQ